MSAKTIILVIITSVLIGVGIFYGQKILKSKNIPSTVLTNTSSGPNTNATIYPSKEPYPAPSYPSVGSNTDLKSALGNAPVPDFSSDYENLEKEIDSL